MKRITETEFIRRIEQRHGNRYKYIEGFKNTNTKVKMYCINCNKYFMSKPSKLFIGQGCPHCRADRISKTNSLTNEEFRKKALAILGDDYIILSDYKNQNSVIKIKHLKCGTIYSMKATYILNKKRKCPKCTKQRVKHSGFRYTDEEFKQQVFELVGDEYTVLSEYINSKTKVLFKHNICGEEFWMQPQKFIHCAERCPACFHSRGEDMTRYFLKKDYSKYKIVSQFKFKDLYFKTSAQPLRFDFALFDDLNNLKFLIEYDGIQHFELGHWNTAEKLAETKIRDKLKDEYCKKHNYKLIRISYKDFNIIERILQKEIIE